jgi:hypothetical protein
MIVMNPKTLFDNHQGHVHVSNYYSLVEETSTLLGVEKVKRCYMPHTNYVVVSWGAHSTH